MGTGADGAIGNDVEHKLRIGIKGVAAFMQWRKEFFEVFNENLLAVHTAKACRGATLTDFGLLFSIAHKHVVWEQVAHVWVARVATAHTSRVREHAAHLRDNIFNFIAQEDAVAIALGHFAAIKTWALGRWGQVRFRLWEIATVEIIETACNFAGQLKVWQLVLAHRYPLRAVHQDVRGHEHRIAHKAKVSEVLIADFLLLLFVRWVTLKPAHRRYHGENQVQFCMLKQARLAENGTTLRVKTRGNPVFHELRHIGRNTLGVGKFTGQRVPVRHKVKAISLVLQFYPVLQNTKVMAKMQWACRTHARCNAGTLSTHNASSRCHENLQ